eukprot:ANDGO_05483.mRNA.1 Mannose-6-phosphate isomerase
MSNDLVASLSCTVHNYAWGCVGATSSVYQLRKAQLSHLGLESGSLDAGKPYAELWMGTHPSGPSFVAQHDGSSALVPLSEIVAKNPEHWLGASTISKFGPNLPFLFKVLSVEKALSIQAHPNKPLAEQLHVSRPDLYKDDNHKPEIALPITPFEALCGFRPSSEIAAFAESIPEFASLIGYSGSSSSRPLHLPSAFAALMNAPVPSVTAALDSLVAKLSAMKKEERSAVENLALRLADEYPGDVGVFCVFFLNHVIVGPGSFIYCAPDEPHAYLKGDCVECMACSDNVVRAGLTPKPKDVDTLLKMLTYRDDLCEKLVGQGVQIQENVALYDPPVPEFKVYRVALGDREAVVSLDGPAVLISLMNTEGSLSVKRGDTAQSKPLNSGNVDFVAAGSCITFDKGGKGVVFVATC